MHHQTLLPLCYSGQQETTSLLQRLSMALQRGDVSEHHGHHRMKHSCFALFHIHSYRLCATGPETHHVVGVEGRHFVVISIVRRSPDSSNVVRHSISIASACIIAVDSLWRYGNALNDAHHSDASNFPPYSKKLGPQIPTIFCIGNLRDDPSKPLKIS